MEADLDLLQENDPGDLVGSDPSSGPTDAGATSADEYSWYPFKSKLVSGFVSHT